MRCRWKLRSRTALSWLLFTVRFNEGGMKPGEYLLRPEPIVANAGRRTIRLVVKHAGDRPVQIGSHYHFFEVNQALHFDRELARGLRLNIAAGTSVRFEPG